MLQRQYRPLGEYRYRWHDGPRRFQRDDIEHHHIARGLVGPLLLGALIALGIWSWPELRRTIQIHRF